MSDVERRQFTISALKTLLALAIAALLGSLSVRAAGLTGGERLAAVYDSILRARFDRASADLQTACPPAPAEACRDLAAVVFWWRIQLDPHNRELDPALIASAEAAITAAEQWTTREPQRAESWFYLAGAYAPLAELRVLRGDRLAAARDGLRIKRALERALALDSTLQDAHFGIGLYHYYAAVAPAALRMVRWLLLLPGGDRDLGLREMQQARTRGQLLRGEADYQMHWVYLWYERQPERALELLRGLDAQYPTNPIFLQRVAEIERDYRHDATASVAAWQQLFDRARDGGVEQSALAGVRARLNLAEAALASGRDAARAVNLLQPIVDARPAAPYGALARAQLVRGRAYDQLGDRDRAIAMLSAAIASAPRDDPDAIRTHARDELARLRARRR